MARNDQEEKLKGIQALAKKYNTSVHTTARALELIKLSLDLDHTVVNCWVGPTGVGKSVGLRKLAHDMDAWLVEWRTANIEKEDVTGLPGMNGDSTYSFAPHKSLADMVASGKRGLVFIDEFNRGGPAVVKAFFNVIENKCFGDLKLPEDTMFVVAMNPSDSNYSVADIMADKALKKRFRFILSDSDSECYLNYVRNPKTEAAERGHPLVIEFLETYPQHVYDHEALECGQLFSTPYHWSRISRTCHAFDQKFPGWATEGAGQNLVSLIEGDVGSTLAEAFEKFVEERQAAIKPEDVLHHFEKYRSRVQGQLDSGRYDTLSELVSGLTTHMISKRPKPSAVAFNVCEFLDMVPTEQARAFTEKLDAEAKKNVDGMSWLMSFNKEICMGPGGKPYPAYARVHAKLTGAEKAL